jgi:hypothetical protein
VRGARGDAWEANACWACATVASAPGTALKSQEGCRSAARPGNSVKFATSSCPNTHSQAPAALPAKPCFAPSAPPHPWCTCITSQTHPPHRLPLLQTHAMNFVQVAGIIAGMLLFGTLGDVIGRCWGRCGGRKTAECVAGVGVVTLGVPGSGAGSKTILGSTLRGVSL